MRITVEPSRVTYDAVQKRLNDMGKGSVAKDVMYKAIREVATWTKNESYYATKKMYTIKSAALKKSDIKLIQASKRHLGAVLTISGESLSLRKSYATRKNGKRVPVKVMVKRSGGLKRLEMQSGGRSYKAFVATMDSGHEGVFRRVPDEYMEKYPNTSTKKGREKIKETFSLAKSKAVEAAYREYVEPDVQTEINYRLHKHMNAVIGGRL